MNEDTLNVLIVDNLTEIAPTMNSSFFQGLDYGILNANVKTPVVVKETLMPAWIQIAWTTVFSVMILTATGGNCIVIWIVTAHRKMRTVTNYFLVNLSIADLLLTTFNCIFNFIYMIQRNWPFGTWYCTVSNFIANATVAASVFTLTGISCDRYLAIVHPLHPRMSRTASLITIIFIWAASMLFAFPCLLYSTTISHTYNGVEKVGCIMIWPDNKVVGSKYDLWYQMLFLVITYIVPMTLMSVCYTVMGRVLWGSRSIGEMTQRQVDSIRSKRKVVKMFILVVMIFAICWLPYHIYFIYVYYDPNIIYKKYTQHVYLSFYWFAMSNAMVNPLIYYWMNARFRQYFKTAICGWKSYIARSQSEELPRFFARNSHSCSKSGGGGGGTIRVNIDPQAKTNGYQSGSAHHESVVTRVNSVGQENMRRGSSRSSRRSTVRRETFRTTKNL